MDDPAKYLGLVKEAITSRTSGCLEWKDDKLQRRVRSDKDLNGLTLFGIKELLISFVSTADNAVQQKTENREAWRDEFDYVYEVLIPVDGLPRDLYVELVLSDPVDEDCPVAVIVNVHLCSFNRRK